jgi:TldD protein
MADIFDTIGFLRGAGPEILARFVRSHRSTDHADIRFEAVFNRSSSANDGEPREGVESESASFGVSVTASDHAGLQGRGQVGVEIGRRALDHGRLVAELRSALNEAWERARTSARERGAIVRAGGARARSLAARKAAAAPAIEADVAPICRIDPRELSPSELGELVRDASTAITALGPAVAFNAVSAMSELRDELYISSGGALIRQGFAFSQGDCYVVAQSADGHQELWDVIGQQRGFEALSEGRADGLMPNPNLRGFALELAREAIELAAAPVLKPPDHEVTVVTDPHFNSLLAHEIVGHPSEADRALKMEAAYAGRSWLLRSLDASEKGHRIGSPLLSAGSDPTIDGYGFYRYDHEGTAGRPVKHIDGGIFREFMNSRATAAILGVEPNGSARATAAALVPLIRMSNTFFMAGDDDPAKMIADVDRGYWVRGHQIPSIAESRENFRISARRVYEIEHGRIGRLYRSGSVMGDSKKFFMNVDAVGNDLRLVAIPNCGKGQPMQAKRMSNGGPTLRSRARMAGG